MYGQRWGRKLSASHRTSGKIVDDGLGHSPLIFLGTMCFKHFHLYFLTLLLTGHLLVDLFNLYPVSLLTFTFCLVLFFGSLSWTKVPTPLDGFTWERTSQPGFEHKGKVILLFRSVTTTSLPSPRSNRSLLRPSLGPRRELERLGPKEETLTPIVIVVDEVSLCSYYYVPSHSTLQKEPSLPVNY